MNKWTIGIITSLIVIPTLVFARDNVKEIWALPEKTKKYEEAYVNVQEFVAEQRTANELERQKFELLKEDQERQWQMIIRKYDGND